MTAAEAIQTGDSLHARIAEWGIAGVALVLFVAVVVGMFALRFYSDAIQAKRQSNQHSADLDGIEQALEAAKGWESVARDLIKSQSQWPAQLAQLVESNRQQFQSTAAKLLEEAEDRCDKRHALAEARFNAAFDEARRQMSKDIHSIAEKMRELYVYSGHKWDDMAGPSRTLPPLPQDLIKG